jgi:DNA-binding response OmpR family regulator
MAKVLVVNDEADLVDICQMVLEERGHEVDTLTEGTKAAARAWAFRPDVIVLDWQLSDTTGGDVLYELRARPATARIPVLMISALVDAATLAREQRVNGFLHKPFTADALIQGVERLVPRT